jgi:hypothetical protein
MEDGDLSTKCLVLVQSVLTFPPPHFLGGQGRGKKSQVAEAAGSKF